MLLQVSVVEYMYCWQWGAYAAVADRLFALPFRRLGLAGSLTALF